MDLKDLKNLRDLLINEKKLEHILEPYMKELIQLIKYQFKITLPNFWISNLDYISYLERFCYTNNLTTDCEYIYKRYEPLI